MAMREEVLTIPVAGANGAAIGEQRTWHLLQADLLLR